MSNIIHVTPEKLKEGALLFQATAGEVRSLTADMTATVQQLTGRVWSGEAANAYTRKFQGLQSDIDLLYRMIIRHGEQMQQIAGESQRQEQENLQMAGSLLAALME